MTKELPLAQLTRAELELLQRAIMRRQLPTPLSEAGLSSIGKSTLFARLGPLAGADERVALALIELAQARTDGASVAAPRLPPLLLWTEPTVTLPNVRATTPVILEMLGSAKEQVVIAGYEFDYGAVIFEPLHKAMSERGVKVSIYLDVRPAPSPKANMSAHLALQAHQLLKRNWPFGAPLPQLYYFPAGCAFGSRRSLHAKCVVVDNKQILVGSANFTRRGHTRNLEVGVRLEDPALATALTLQLSRLVENGELLPLPITATLYAAPPMGAEDDANQESDPVLAAPNALAAELMVSEVARPLFERLVAHGVPIPQVGEDVEGTAGHVIGSPELSWDEQRVAVLLPEQEGSRKQLEAFGWTCFSIDLSPEELEALCERVRQGG